MKLLRFDSLAWLRRQADRWDDLWRRSQVTLPTLRAELLAQWVEQFAPGRRFLALAVEENGDLVAALPLVGERPGLGLLAARLPRNDWTDGGDLLVDESRSADALQVLADGVRRLPWSVFHGGGVEADSPGWQDFLAILRQRGGASAARPQYDVGLIDVTNDWAAYEASLSGNHRRALRKSLKKLEAEHPAELEIHRPTTASDAARLFQIVCEVEDKSWKGEAGTSILRAPGMLDFFRRQAAQLAEWNQLEILFLQHNGRPIAAEYGFTGKGVYHSHKIAYDPAYSSAGPGRLLRHLQLQQYCADQTYMCVDTLGILSEANAKWATRKRTVSRLVVGAGPVGNGLVLAYRDLWPKVKRLLGRRGFRSAAKLGAENQGTAASAAREEEPHVVHG